MGWLPNCLSKQKDDKQANLKSALEKLRQHRRDTYIPVVKDGDGPNTSSKISGIPYIAKGEAWPICENCKKPMQLFVQLVGSDLPKEAKIAPNHCIQLFYCCDSETPCEVEGECWSVPSVECIKAFQELKPEVDISPRCALLRLVYPAQENDSPSTSPVPDAFPPKRIVEWVKTDDYPNLEEVDASLTEDEENAYWEEFPRTEEKLLGWPHWIQGVEYVECPKCNSTMRFVFQIDSEKNIPHMFGDCGVGHILQCPNHPEILSFGWACC